MARNIFEGNSNDDSRDLFSSKGNGLVPRIITTPEAKPIGLTSLIVASAGNQALRSTMTNALRERYNVLQLKDDMLNVAIVSATADSLSVAVPSCAERCKLLADSYTIGLAMRRARG